jgi:hypothetical protein
MNFTLTSAIETVDVNAATMSRRKNKTDQSLEAGSIANTSGRVINTRVVPLNPLSLRWKLETAGKMMRPIKKAITKVIETTVDDVRTSLVCGG